MTNELTNTEPGGEHPPLLRLLGTRRGERREVHLGQRRIALTPKCFKFLAKLAICRSQQPERWVTRDELERGENQARYLYRLKGELESQCGSLFCLWENNRRGGYRLTLPPQRIEVNWSVLETYDDYDLVAWVQALRPAVVRCSERSPAEQPAVRAAV